MNRCLPRTVRRVVLIAALAMASRAPTRASESAPKTLDPTTYKSPSGAFTLTVDPSDIYGRYGGAYRVTKNGKELWSATLPFTFWQASVTDTGVVAGYAHTLGQRGFGETRDEPRPGDLIVAIIDPSGKIRLKQVTKRQESRYLHSPPDPLGHGLIVDEPNDRLIVRVLNEGRDEIWWTYRLSTGAVLDKPAPHRSMPNAEPARWILDAKLIQGTPLVLLHWWRFDFQVGARFTLVDREAKPVWSLELPSDYMVKGSEAAQDKLQDWIREHGGILRTDQAHEFDLFFAAESKRVTFAVKQSPTGEWVVTETARAPFSIASPEDSKLAAIPKRSLKDLGTLVLQANRAADDSPVRNVRDFVFDGKGRIAFLREDDDRTSFVLVDQTGKSVREIPLKMQPKADVSRWSGHCWVGGSRFVISLSEFGVDGKAQAWWVDAETGKVEPIPAFDCPSIERLVGATDGRFVALAILRSKYTLEKFVIGFDSQGRRQWSLKDDFNNKEPGSLFSVEGIALTTEGEIVVLENIVNTLKFFDRDGHFRRAIDLKQAWGRKPNYVAGITADVDGGFLVSDFHGSPPFVRMARDGAVRGGFVPKHRRWSNHRHGLRHGSGCRRALLDFRRPFPDAAQRRRRRRASPRRKSQTGSIGENRGDYRRSSGSDLRHRLADRLGPRFRLGRQVDSRLPDKTHRFQNGDLVSGNHHQRQRGRLSRTWRAVLSGLQAALRPLLRRRQAVGERRAPGGGVLFPARQRSLGDAALRRRPADRSSGQTPPDD